MELNRIYNEDCLQGVERILSGSVDLILTDPPYGNMNTDGGRKLGINGWDFAIDPTAIFEASNRILRKNGKMILFSQEPYTTELRNKAIPSIPFSYRAIWEKDSFANALGVNKAMTSLYEDVLIFSKPNPKHDFEGVHPLREYFEAIKKHVGLKKKEIISIVGQRVDHAFRTQSSQFSLCTEKTYFDLIALFDINKMDGFKQYSELETIDSEYRQSLIFEMNEKYPSVFNLWEGNKHKPNILKYKKDYDGYHPTQKPVLLLEDLIKTFSNEGDTVVDLTMGSGSTGVACKNTNRNFIGFELNPDYFDIANDRIQKAAT